MQFTRLHHHWLYYETLKIMQLVCHAIWNIMQLVNNAYIENEPSNTGQLPSTTIYHVHNPIYRVTMMGQVKGEALRETL